MKPPKPQDVNKKRRVRLVIYVAAGSLIIIACAGYLRLRSALAVQSLILAIKHDNVANAKTALDKGADPNALVGLASGWDSADYEESKVDLIEMLLGTRLHGGIRETPLLLATEEGKDDVAQLLILRGANVNFSDTTGSTALQWAAHNGNAETVQMLVDKGADINSRWKDGTPVIDNAQGRPEILAILKQAGAKE